MTMIGRKHKKIAKFYANPDDFTCEPEPVLIHIEHGTDALIEFESGEVSWHNMHHVVIA